MSSPLSDIARAARDTYDRDRLPVVGPTCAPLAETVANFHSSHDSLSWKVRQLLRPVADAGFDGDLTVTMRRAQNGASSIHVKVSTLSKER